MTSLPLDAADPTPSPDEERPGVVPHREAPSYDADLEGYTGISVGALGDAGDVRDARAFAEMIVDTIREGLLVLDFDLYVKAANESFYRTFDVRPEDTVGRLVYDLGNGQWDLPELRELLEDILPHERAFDDYEVDHEFAGLGRRVMLLNARRLNDHQLVLLAVEDVTERRRSERAFRESEGRYRALFTSMDQGYGVIEMVPDEDGTFVDYRFLETNPAFEAQSGLVDAVGRTARELIPDLEDHWVEVYGRVARTGEPARFEQESEAMGRWFDVFASRVGGPGSRRVALLFSDITERKAVEEARRESERRYRALFQQAPAFIAVLREPEHVFEFVNPAYLRLVGERELLGRPLREALPELEGQGLFELLDGVYREGKPFTAVDRPIVLQRAEGAAAERRYVDFVYEPLREPDGTVSGVIALGVDTTERVEAREALDRANRGLEEANRELETRVDARTRQVREQERRVRELSRALALAEQAERRRIAQVLHDDLQQVLFGAQMASSTGDAERHNALLAEALETTRTLSHSLSPPFLEGEDVEDLLRWVAERHSLRHGLEVEVEASGDVPVPDAALRVLLYQLVRELLFNVAKHAGTGRARVRAERAGDLVRVTVEDEGAGFDPAALEEAGAVGLGLRSVRERVGLVGGQLEVASEPGGGTRVSITVPVVGGSAEGMS